MDITPDDFDAVEPALSYDETIAYSDLPPPPPTEPTQPSLAGRIGQTKVYLISDAIASRSGKRKHEEEEEEEQLDEMEEDVSDPSLRDNAILLHGDPISYLPTENLFAYATYFDAHPIGLEWIDDTTCILVFPSKMAARSGFRTLTKSFTEDPSEEGFVTSKAIPIAIWPPEKRINNSLGKDEGLKGPVRMRWALTSDVKKRGANKESQFYRKYGKKAGKGEAETEERWPSDGYQNDMEEMAREAERKAALDAELDAFLAEGEDQSPTQPTSKMRSDHIDSRGHASASHRHGESLASRITAPLPRRSRGGRTSLGDRISEPHTGHRGGREREGPRAKRPKKTQEELDAELDAFLNSKD